MTKPSFFTSWARSTALGWAVGVPAIVLLATLAESLGQHSLLTPVGAGMGLAVGYFQYRAIRSRLDRSARWFWSCFIGLAAPFLAVDLARAASLSVPYSLYVAVITGGLILGVWQGVLLCSAPVRAAFWVAASVLGWGLASASVALADSLVRDKAIRGIPGALAYLGLVATGGILLAVLTGIVLVRLLPSPPAT